MTSKSGDKFGGDSDAAKDSKQEKVYINRCHITVNNLHIQYQWWNLLALLCERITIKHALHKPVLTKLMMNPLIGREEIWSPPSLHSSSHSLIYPYSLLNVVGYLILKIECQWAAQM